MPNLPMHIYLAKCVADRLDWGWLNDHAPSLYLGSTAPDVRAMTKWPRERTHFAPLSFEEVGAGPAAMFKLHPGLAGSKGPSPATRAFLVGYVSHLVADESWVTNVFRPNFDPPPGSPASVDTQLQGHIYDRTLQLDMDRTVLPVVGSLLNNGQTWDDAPVGVDVEFIDRDTLSEWSEWVSRFLTWEFSWDRLKRALNRMYRDDQAVQDTVAAFIEDMPASLDRVYSKIPQVAIEAYFQGALKETLVQVRERWDDTQT